jgi:BirA family transcriptional regulator, biotin operon repressor / biotin---[acetyl-CoA-carboxylase] ligase
MPAPRAPLDKSIITSLTSQYWRVSVVELTASTQSDLVALVNSSVAKPGDLIAAEFQSAGRGRLDRNFQAPSKSALLFSFYVTPKRNSESWSFISFLAAIALQEIISKDHSEAVTLKWPNDVLIGEKKVAGLLAEQTGEGVVIGIGVNVTMTEEELPVPTATSLAISGFVNLDRNILLANFLNHFEELFKRWEEGEDFLERYLQISSTIGRKVRVEVSGREPVEGLAIAISSQGALILEDGFEVNVGDVVHLR